MKKKFIPPLFLDMSLISQIINRGRSQTYAFMDDVAAKTGKNKKYLTIGDIATATKATKQEIIDRIKGILGVEEEQLSATPVVEQRPLKKAS